MGMDSDGCMTVAIVGGGASGVLSAIHLLHLENPDLRVILIEPREIGAGAAYVTDNPEHILNVVAARMSAYPDLPAHFLRWVNRITPTRPCDFVSRSFYRRYLQDVLTVAQAHLEPDRFIHHHAAVTCISPESDGATLTLDTGEIFHADKVILALGNQTPRTPETDTPEFSDAPAYLGTPWAANLNQIPPEDDILLIGTGLTTVDVLLTLHKRGHHGQITAVSRHGRLPLPHTEQSATHPALNPPLTSKISVLFRWIRQTIAQAEADGIPWQLVLDMLRPHTNFLWQSLTIAERKRFNRHIAPLWNIARHRIPKSSAKVIEHLTSIGQLQIIEGRLQRVDRSDGELLTTVRQPHGHTQKICSRWIINCTGPNPDLTSAESPVLRGLFTDGHIAPDPLRMGLDTMPDGALINQHGKASGVLYAVGPLRRGGLLESTAIHEIREQAAALAGIIGQPLTV